VLSSRARPRQEYSQPAWAQLRHGLQDEHYKYTNSKCQHVLLSVIRLEAGTAAERTYVIFGQGGSFPRTENPGGHLMFGGGGPLTSRYKLAFGDIGRVVDNTYGPQTPIGKFHSQP
jgi:hypothetical protein